MSEIRSVPEAPTGPTRRQVLQAGTGIVVGLGATTALTACGGGSGSDGPTPSGEPVTVAKADIPVGGALLLDTKYAVTQPNAGEFKAFSKTCPHQGCEVSQIHEKSLVCACHTSLFSINDGSRESGPARTGLREVAVREDGDNLLVG